MNIPVFPVKPYWNSSCEWHKTWIEWIPTKNDRIMLKYSIYIHIGGGASRWTQKKDGTYEWGRMMRGWDK